MVQVDDFLYGKMQFSQVFLDLLNTEALIRLAGIHQSGAVFLVNPGICHSRLEHSKGVMMLIKYLGGTELEQIAGLLHDVSHTAFSHVGDYVFNNTDENYHEQIFEEFLLKSDIPQVLINHGYHIDEIIFGDFKILEQPLPLLCADRLDYTLRDAIHGGIISRQRAKIFLNDITLKNGVIAVNSENEVEWINETFVKLNNELFRLPINLYANGKMAEIIRDFMDKNILSKDDMLKTDTMLLNKIRSTIDGYEAIKAIKQLKGFAEFMRHGAVPKIKARVLKAFIT
ncbi:HD domain-containing protein [Pedobacter mucosus]|uniref:HD domain-containing protein n=1 Tax=Pedobacter mucosus TaxID=2895286 RepID=UPI001EE42213|nr:HD domain-containing protein [Pedobacter mucosus]UKT65115.1 HD domain-containing protein [Pedobacter mucosus]